jgi:hypothetical protein
MIDLACKKLKEWYARDKTAYYIELTVLTGTM